jgi:phosphoribosylamine--glycine ligase
MRILIVGGGAREDALSWRLAQSPSCEALFHAPGNAGTASRGVNFSDVGATDARAILDRARSNAIDLVVIGPETSLAAGVADRLREGGLLVFGPNRSGARLESSKTFAKRFMERHAIPTARFAVVHNIEQSRKALASFRGGVVVKADGLAAGKGVVVCDDAAAADIVLAEWYAKNSIPGGGADVVLEEKAARWCRSRRRATTSAPATTIAVRTRAAWARIRRRPDFRMMRSTSCARRSSRPRCAGCSPKVKSIAACSTSA